jgi:tetratricopeptide (TPR) repeat protein
MTRLRVWIGGALLVPGLLSQATPSFADKPGAAGASDAPTSPVVLAPKQELEGPEAEAKNRARVLFQRGVSAYRDAKYYDAVQIFLETQRIYPDTQLCFNIARAYENLGNVNAALSYYREYLRRADRPSDGADVRERVHKLQEQLAERGLQQLTVLSEPVGATLVLDGKPAGITPWTGETYPGKHRLLLELAHHLPTERVIDVEANEARDFSLALSPEPKPVALPLSAPALSAELRPGVSVSTLLALGIGLSLLGGALVAEAASSQPGMSRTTAFLAGSGLGVTGVGGFMLYFELAPQAISKRPAPSRTKDSATAGE